MLINTFKIKGLVCLLILGVSTSLLVAQGRRPLGPQEIVELLKGGVPAPRVVALVGQLGVDFRLTASLEKELREAGADADLMAAVRKETRKRLPEEAERHLALGAQHAGSGEYASAIGEFDQATKLALRWPEAYLGRARAYLALQNYTMAQEDLRRALELSPRPSDQEKIKEEMGRLEATLKRQRIELLARHLEQAGKMEQAADWVALEREARAALKLDSNNAEAHAWLAVALVRNGRPEDAVRESEEALRLAPDLAMAHWTRGLIILFTAGDREEAQREFQRTVDLDPQSIRGYAYLAMEMRTQSDLEGAIRTIRHAMELVPAHTATHTQLRYLLANFLYEKRDWDGALSELRFLTELDPRNPSNYLQICAALRNKEDVDGALAACAQALKLDSNSATALHLQALLLEKKGNLEGAVSSLRQAATLSPNDQAIRQNLDRLEKLNYRPSLKR